MAKQISVTMELTRSVATDIVSGDLAPGARLPLPQLGERYGASSIPLREALSRLANQGLVVFEDKKGFSVAPVSRADLIDLTETRIAVETLAMRRAIARGDLDWEAQILSVFHKLSRMPTYADAAQRHLSPEWEETHARFHHQLVAACGSPRLLAIRDTLNDQSRRYRFLAGLLAREPRRVDEEHAALVDAALAREVDRACTLIAAHFQKTTDLILASGKGGLA